MPLNNPAPRFGLLTAYDVRNLSATKIFTRGSTAVNLPTFTTGQGVYEDAIHLLNARSSKQSNSATSQLTSVASFGSGWSVTIDENDKVVITSAVQFELQSTGSSDPLGFGSSQISSSASGSNYVIAAPNDWSRGLLTLNGVSYTITETGGSGSFNWPLSVLEVQDVTVFLRDRSTVSDDDAFGLQSIEELDQTAVSSSLISWSVTDEGYCQVYYQTALGHITWNSDVMRDTLGFTGSESPVAISGYSRLTSTHKIAGVLIPSRPYQDHHLNIENVAQARRLIGGGYASNLIGHYTTSRLTFNLDALLDESDDYKHFSNRWTKLGSMGERVNFYQGWGDSRRSLRTAEISASQPAFDLLFTSEDNGEYGRIRASITLSGFELAYPGSLKRRVPVVIEMEHL